MNTTSAHNEDNILARVE
jgi:hypothetical protein